MARQPVAVMHSMLASCMWYVLQQRAGTRQHQECEAAVIPKAKSLTAALRHWHCGTGVRQRQQCLAAP